MSQRPPRVSGDVPVIEVRVRRIAGPPLAYAKAAGVTPVYQWVYEAADEELRAVCNQARGVPIAEYVPASDEEDWMDEATDAVFAEFPELEEMVRQETSVELAAAAPPPTPRRAYDAEATCATPPQ